MPAADLPLPDAEARSNRRVWWGLAGLFALLLGTAAWFYLFFDIPAPDPALYRYEFKPVPPGENVIEVFARDTETLRKAMQEDWTNRLAENKQLLKFEPGCETSLRAHVEAHRALLEKFQWLMREAPRPLVYPGVNAEMTVDGPYTSSLAIQVGQLVQQALMLKALSGDAKAACEDALELAAFAKELSQTDGTLLHWLVMLTEQSLGLKSLQELLPKTELDVATASEWAAQLAAIELASGDLANAIRVEYYAQANFWNRWNDKSRAFPAGDLGWLGRRLVKPNMAIQETSEHLQPLARSLEKDWKQGWVQTQNLEEIAKAPDRLNWKSITHPNFFGRREIFSNLVSFAVIVRRTIDSVVFSRCLQTALALRAHELETGRRAGKLEQLVPDYLPAVPEDPLTGRPLKWNAQTTRLYSVGEDGRDNGGSFDPDKKMRDQPDCGIEYPWR